MKHMFRLMNKSILDKIKSQNNLVLMNINDDSVDEQTILDKIKYRRHLFVMKNDDLFDEQRRFLTK